MFKMTDNYIQKALEADSAWLDMNHFNKSYTSDLFLYKDKEGEIETGLYIDDGEYEPNFWSKYGHLLEPTGYAPLNAPDLLFAEVKRLRQNNYDLTQRNALLRQRPDLPVDRIPAHDELVRLRAQLDVAVGALEKGAKVYDDVVGLRELNKDALKQIESIQATAKR
jgi:hypothetical protein